MAAEVCLSRLVWIFCHLPYPTPVCQTDSREEGLGFAPPLPITMLKEAKDMQNIFGLIDPGTGWIRYVGSTKAIHYRPTDWLAFLHRTHQMQLNKGRRHAAWEALMQQRELNAVLLERTEDPNAKARWVKLLQHADHPLLNKR
jgi:hypothetical protein